jgi:hypothetical protein
VSAAQQGVSGLGLEAQREAVTRYVSHHGTLLAEYVEVESGKDITTVPSCKRRQAHETIRRGSLCQSLL